MGTDDRAQAVKGSLGEIATVFVRIGCLGFGGPVAVMAMMERETVASRGWLSPSEFAQVYALCKLLPGPVATQMGIYLGRVRGGALGGIVAGVAYISPSFLLILGLAAAYTRWGVVPGAAPALMGLQAAALAVIVVSTWALSKPYRGQPRAWMIAVFCTALVAWSPRIEPVAILAFGLASAVWTARRAALMGGVGLASLAAKEAMAQVGAHAASDPAVLGKLFWMCLKGALFVFGTGLAVVPVLEGDAVGRHQWITHSQFMDGIAMGQVTPGPVTITSTFVGYLVAGLPGAFAATAGMFLPSFFNVLVIVPRVWRRLSGTAASRGFLDGAIPAVVGGILGATLRLGSGVLISATAAAIFAAALVATLLRCPPWLLIPLAGLVGYLTAVGIPV